MQLIQLEPADMILAAHHSGLQSGVKKVQAMRGEVTNKRISNNADYNIAYIGMLGEIAVSKYLNIPINSEILAGGDGGIDMYYKGQSIQIKTRTFTTAPIYLMYKTLEEIKSDWTVLCTIETPTSVGIRGFISKTKFLAKAVTQDFSYGPSYVVDSKELADIDLINTAIK